MRWFFWLMMLAALAACAAPPPEPPLFGPPPPGVVIRPAEPPNMGNVVMPTRVLPFSRRVVRPVPVHPAVVKVQCPAGTKFKAGRCKPRRTNAITHP